MYNQVNNEWLFPQHKMFGFLNIARDRARPSLLAFVVSDSIGLAANVVVGALQTTTSTPGPHCV